MPARAHTDEETVLELLKLLTTHGGAALSDDQKLELLYRYRGQSEQVSRDLDGRLIRLISRCQGAIEELRSGQAQQKAIIDQLTAFPWHPAVFLQTEPTPEGEQALVLYGNSPRLVGLADEVDVADLVKGDTVYLSHELNVILAQAAHEIGRFGDTATFERLTADGRAIVSCRDEEKVAELVGAVSADELKKGDLVRWRPETGLVFEKLERASGEHLLLQETPQETFENVGGLETQIGQLKRVVALHFRHPEMVRRYGLRRTGSVLLEGPPGTGKTLLARALANYMAKLSPSSRSLWIHCRPGGLNSKWFGQTEANYREVFRVARELAAANPDATVIVFFDEVDSIGIARGSGMQEGSGRIEDRVQTAFMSELDGLETRAPNILVVAATNRREVLDPALARAGRLGDVVIKIPRPSMKAAMDIFAKHLRADIPYARNGHGGDLLATRQEIINTAVSRAYAPNADNAVATILFRDGKQQTVRAADLINGATIANIARSAVEKACVRELETGEVGIQLNDVLSAMTDELETAARMLTPFNCRQHLTGLPQDVGVASVEPVVRKVARPHRFMNMK